jgi:hypothetical protein
MMHQESRTRIATIAIILLGLQYASSSALTAAAEQESASTQDPISSALTSSKAAERRFHEHVVFLAHPALEGRLPGDEGSHIAEQLIARTFSQLGLNPAFDQGTYFQAFTFKQGGRFKSRDEARIVEGRNVGAILPGQGELAEQWVLVGAHHDHLGRGAFGSRRGAGMIHEGADDNASGTAAVLLAAEIITTAVNNPELVDTPRRSVFFVTFSGEESGLNGSAHLAENLPMPIESIALMINVDMIGRIQDRSVSANGTGTGSTLNMLLDQVVGEGGLTVLRPSGLTSRSDHAEFYRRGVPVLFFTESTFPDEYHTPDDESWRINVRDGAAASDIIARVALLASITPEAPDHQKIDGFETGDGGPSLADMKVRFGIKPGNYGDVDPGIAVSGVSADTSAEDAGIMTGDRLLAWNGTPIEGIREWMMMMTAHEPGDVVTVTLLREGAEIELPVMLKPRLE